MPIRTLGEHLPLPLLRRLEGSLRRVSPGLLSRVKGEQRWKREFDRTGIALVHIPKTAGTSISGWLYGAQIGHRSWKTLEAMDPDGFGAWLKLAITRDPVDRFLSAWDYLSAGGGSIRDRAFAKRFVLPGSLQCFTLRLAQEPEFRRQVLAFFHFRPQADFVLAPSGRVMVDRLVPFERVPDLPRILGIERPLPKSNAAHGPRTGRESLSAQSLETIREIYRRDAAVHALAGAHDADLFGTYAPPDAERATGTA